MSNDYRWLAVIEELENRSKKLCDTLGSSVILDGLCSAKAISLGLMVSDVEASLKVIRSMLAASEGDSHECGEDSRRGCWVCRPMETFQTLDGEIVQLEEDDAWKKERRGEGVRMVLVETLQPRTA